MHSPARRTALTLMYLAIGVTAAGLVASHTPLGAALSMDSLSYLSAARNFIDGNGIAVDTYALHGPTIVSMTLWPPLYPLLLAGLTSVASLAGISDVIAVAVFNVFALIVSLILFVRIASLTGLTTAGFVVAIVLAISPSFQLVFMYAWSEVLFIPLSLAAYLGLQRHLMENAGRRRLDLYAMVVLLGLATYTRYVGLAFFAAAALALLLYGRGGPLERLRIVSAVFLAYVATLAPLLIRNLAVSGSLSGGDRGTPDTNLLSDLSALVWYLYLEFLNLPLLYAAVVVSITVASATWLICRRSPEQPAANGSFRSSSVVVPFLFAVCYLAFLLISRKRQIIDLDSRMLSVAMPFMLLGLLGVYRQLSLRTRSSLATVPFVLPLAAFITNAVHTHSSILTGWRELGEPGPILGMTYRSITGRQLDGLRIIGQHFPLTTGDLVLTDISRPVIVDYLFPEADVRTMPGIPNAESLDLLQAPLERSGLAIIGSMAWSQELAKDLDGHAGVYRVEAQTGGPEFMVIKLPVESP